MASYVLRLSALSPRHCLPSSLAISVILNEGFDFLMAARLSALKMKNAEGAYGFLGPLALVADFLPFLPAFFVPFFDAVVFFSLAAAFALIVARAFFAAATRLPNST